MAPALNEGDWVIALRGWDVGTLRSADLDANRVTTFTYRIKTPANPVFFREAKIEFFK